MLQPLPSVFPSLLHRVLNSADPANKDAPYKVQGFWPELLDFPAVPLYRRISTDTVPISVDGVLLSSWQYSKIPLISSSGSTCNNRLRPFISRRRILHNLRHKQDMRKKHTSYLTCFHRYCQYIFPECHTILCELWTLLIVGRNASICCHETTSNRIMVSLSHSIIFFVRTFLYEILIVWELFQVVRI